MKFLKVMLYVLMVIWILPLCIAVKMSSSEPYLEKTDILRISLDGPSERILKYHYFNPKDNLEVIPFEFTIDDFIYSKDAYVTDSLGKPIIIDGVEEKVKIEEISVSGSKKFRYTFGTIAFHLKGRAADYLEFHEPIPTANYLSDDTFSIRQKIVASSDARFLRVEFRIPKKPQSVFRQYSLFLTKIDPAPDTIYETPNEKVFIWNLGELSFGDFFYIELKGGYKTSWFPLKDKFFAWLLGFSMAILLKIRLVRKKKQKK